MSFVRLERLVRGPDDAAPGCDGCTACCVVLPIVELRKPARRACDHVDRAGCRVHPTRPESCRAFHCAWVRGAVTGGEATRPDVLGVMFDAFRERGAEGVRVVAHELWPGALEGDAARGVIRSLAAVHEVALSHRDGRWSVLSPGDP